MNVIQMPLFSVVITTHNRPAFLRQAIDSVLSQSIEDFEIIIVDDGSDPPAQGHEDPRVRVLRQSPAAGPAAARNLGARNAKGVYLTFLDDDDWYTSSRLQVALDGLDRAPVSICWSGYADEAVSPGPVFEGWVHDHILDFGHAPGAVVTALHRQCFIPFDPDYTGNEDIDWWLRLSDLYPVSTVPSRCYLVRRHPEVRDLNGFEARLETSLLLLREYHDYFDAHPRARAFRWRRIADYQLRLGRRRQATSAVLRALRIKPDLRTSVHLFRVLFSRSA